MNSCQGGGIASARTPRVATARTVPGMTTRAGPTRLVGLIPRRKWHREIDPRSARRCHRFDGGKYRRCARLASRGTVLEPLGPDLDEDVQIEAIEWTWLVKPDDNVPRFEFAVIRFVITRNGH
ncbi:hypothetical protein GS4_05_03030 [Gordonia soli NBRC 108243]|uniref:Uncharacterized protein n=1 Tax=Gordonia soli NBRC 108243 TaxID=1223545 RepID=M0QER0_9ACTN|nr:hypothetical protein GS4_05_03030 [Gordonia soli NBRC 108243]